MPYDNPPAGMLPEEADSVDIRLGNLKTIEEWSQEPGMPVVIDPDGFDRQDPRLWDRLFSEGEFLDGALRSTILPAPEEEYFHDLDDYDFEEKFFRFENNDWE